MLLNQWATPLLQDFRIHKIAGLHPHMCLTIELALSKVEGHWQLCRPSALPELRFPALPEEAQRKAASIGREEVFEILAEHRSGWRLAVMEPRG